MSELQAAIDNIFKANAKRFQITKLKHITIVRILSSRYQYIHVKQNGTVFTMQLFELDIATGEKHPISAEITNSAFEVLQKMQPTITSLF